MTNESELKNCPFCNHKAELVICKTGKPDIFSYHIICPHELCRTGESSEKEAIEKWNTRVKLQECERCDKIEKWSDHAGCSPNKAARYEKLLEFVKKINTSHCLGDTDEQGLIRLVGYEREAEDLLQEIGEDND